MSQRVFDGVHSLNDGVASVSVWGARGGRGPGHGEQSVAPVEVAERHGVQVLTQQELQLLVLSSQLVSLSPHGFSLQDWRVEAPRHLLQRWHVLHTHRSVKATRHSIITHSFWNIKNIYKILSKYYNISNGQFTSSRDSVFNLCWSQWNKTSSQED